MKFRNSVILLELRILLAENIRAQYKATTLRVHENLATVLIFRCLVADKIILLMQFSAANWKNTAAIQFLSGESPRFSLQIVRWDNF